MPHECFFQKTWLFRLENQNFSDFNLNTRYLVEALENRTNLYYKAAGMMARADPNLLIHR